MDRTGAPQTGSSSAVVSPDCRSADSSDFGSADPSRIGVFLLESCEIIRAALGFLLQAEPDIRVVGQAEELGAALERIKRSNPDVVLVDPKAGRPGLEAISLILRAEPRTRVVVFTDRDNATYVRAAIDAGASGYVLRSASRDDLLRALRQVHRGHHFLQPEITGPLLGRLPWKAASDGGARLTTRELEILQHLADGESNKEIAESLGISPQTVKTHLKQLFKKLEVADRTAAVALALRCRLVG